MRIEEIPSGGDLSRFLRAYAALSQEDRAELRPLLAPKWGFLDWISMRTPPLVGTMAEVMHVCGSQEEWQRVLAAQEHVLTDPEFCRAVRVEWPLPEGGLLWGTVALLMVRKRMPPEQFATLYEPWESKIPNASILAVPS